MLKKYSFIFTLFIILSTTELLSMSVMELIKSFYSIECISENDMNEDIEIKLEKQEKNIVDIPEFQHAVTLLSLYKIQEFRVFKHSTSSYSNIFSPPPELS